MNYLLKRSARARALRISIYPDGGVVVTAPLRTSAVAIERFVAHSREWILKKVAATANRQVIRVRRADIPRLKREALLLAEERVRHYAGLYGLSYRAISIRAQKTRWGSCSHRGNLSFNYRIAILPQHLVDYIVVHEVCHLGQLNHSKRFWDLVARAIPSHKADRAELRRIATMFE